MKNILKTIFVILIIFSGLKVSASELSQIIENSPLEQTSVIAVSVKNVENNKTIYQHNEKKLLHPASTLKVFTSIPAFETLGEDYNFTTTFYVLNNNLYIKVGADALLTSKDLMNAFKEIKAKGYNSFNNVYIDESIMDNVEWGIGWMWDDNTNPLIQKFSAYNLNNNLANISISKNDNGSISVKAPSEYQFPIINTLKAGETNNIYAIRQEWIYPDVVCLKGSIASNATISVPINNMKKYYQKVVLKTMKDVGINTVQKMCFDSNIPQNAKKITTIKHPILPLMDKILKNSNNMYAETLTKLAGGVKYNSTASISLQRKLFYDYWQNKNVDLSDINVVDGSGVSRNNLVTVDFMTEALNKLYQDKGENFMKSYLAQPGEGTLSSRLLNYRGAVYLKTGTLSNVSGLCGYVVSDSGKTYSVAILIQNFMYPTKDVKLFENKLIEEIKKM